MKGRNRSDISHRSQTQSRVAKVCVGMGFGRDHPVAHALVREEGGADAQQF